MRFALIAVLCLPTLSFAETRVITGAPTRVTLHPDTALVTREIPVSLPAGDSTLRLTDLPLDAELDTARIDIQGAALVASSARYDAVPPDERPDSAAVLAARANVTTLETQLREQSAQIAKIRAESDAQTARIAFLADLGSSDATAGMSVDALQALGAMIAQDTQTARITAIEAQTRADLADRAFQDTRDALDAARRALKALQTSAEEFASMDITVRSQSAQQSLLSLTYQVQAGWAPAYDIHLNRETGALRIKRDIQVQQTSGEDWEGVALTVSTAELTTQSAPSQVYERLVRIEDERPVSVARSMEAVPFMEMPVIVEEATMVGPSVSFNGLVATYRFAQPVDVANRADIVRLSFDTVQTLAQIHAAANPTSDRTGFIMAEAINDFGEPLLPSNAVSLFLDGAQTGSHRLDESIAVGGAMTLPFGSIEGLRLRQIVKNRNEGDGSIFTRSNERTDEVTLVIENLTRKPWPLRVRHAVPYSEQDDLDVTWSANPAPTTDTDEDRRGILRWDLEVSAESTIMIDVSTRLSWPEGKVLR